MASIHQHGRKWRVRWRELDPRTGRRRDRSRVVSTKRAAETLLREVQQVEDLRRQWRGRSAPPPGLQAAIADYLDHREEAGLAGGTIARHTTELGQLLDAARTLTDPDAPTVAHLSRDLLRAYLRQQRARGIVASIVNRMKTAESFWAWAAAQPRYRQHVATPERISGELVEPPRVRKPAPTWAEMDLLVHAARARRKDAVWFGELFTIARFTGLRCGQIMRLEWRDINFDEHLLTVRPELGKSRQEKSGRLVPISPHLTTYLAGRGQRTGRILSHSLTAPTHRTLVSICERSGVRREVWASPGGGRRGRKLHMFRHGLATNLITDGHNPDLVRILLGHAAGTQTLDTYTDLERLARTTLRTIAAGIPPIGGDVLPMRPRVTAVSSGGDT